MRGYGNPTTPPPAPWFFGATSVDYHPRPPGWPPPRASSSLMFVSGQAEGTGNGAAWHIKALAPLREKPGTAWASRGKPTPNDPMVRSDKPRAKPGRSAER